MKNVVAYSGLFLIIALYTGNHRLLHAEEPLSFMREEIATTDAWVRALHFSDKMNACTEVLTSFDDAIADPFAGCELFITSHEPLVISEKVYKLAFAESIGIDGPPTVRIPRTFWTVKSLKELQIANAGLTSVSSDIGQLTHLSVLDLSGNQLTSLPESIRKLKKLRVLFLQKNPLTDAAIRNIRIWLPDTRIVFSAPEA